MKNSSLSLLSKKDIVKVNWNYLLISKSDKNKLGGVTKITQKATTLYFKKCFQFQCLPSQNEQLNYKTTRVLICR
jgi:hypothetical protein